MPKVTVRLEDHVMVKLTERGEEIWREAHAGWYAPIPDNKKVSLSLKEFMRIFGAHLDDYHPSFDPHEITIG